MPVTEPELWWHQKDMDPNPGLGHSYANRGISTYDKSSLKHNVLNELAPLPLSPA